MKTVSWMGKLQQLFATEAGIKPASMTGETEKSL